MSTNAKEARFKRQTAKLDKHRAEMAKPESQRDAAKLMPPRERLYAACDSRFVTMIEADALGEAAKLAHRGLDRDLPSMKVVGLRELLGHLRGEMSLADAIAAAQRATRQYAKRQTTWFRHQTAPDLTLTEQFSQGLLRSSLAFVRESVLTG